VSEEQGERFHQEIKEMERRYQVGGMLTWWVTTAVHYVVKFRKPHIRGRALPAREKTVQAHWIKFNL
jgi:hypothetical protein